MKETDAITEIDRLLKRSEVFGWIWIMGIGSIISIMSVVKAARMMNEAGISDKKRLTGLFVLGIAGLLVAVSAFLIIIIFRKGKQT
jgi:hypothetical protein